MEELKPCPFCGTALVWEEWKTKLPRPSILRYWKHESVGCILDLLEVYPDEVVQWNRRCE